MLSAEQSRFLIDNPSIRDMAFSLRQHEGPDTARRYLQAVMNPPEDAPIDIVCGVNRTSLGEARKMILAALQRGPKTRKQLQALGLARANISRNLRQLKQQGLLIVEQHSRREQATYHLVQERQA